MVKWHLFHNPIELKKWHKKAIFWTYAKRNNSASSQRLTNQEILHSMAYFQFFDVNAHRTASDLANAVWDIVIKWNYFEKNTLGKQFATAADSISANIAEGFGRYHKKDKIKFYHYALGSTTEANDWNRKAFHRKLLTPEQFKSFSEKIDRLPREIRTLIKLTDEKLTI